MVTNSIKLLMALALSAGILAGCTSTEEMPVEEETTADTSVDTGGANNGGVVIRDPAEDMPALAKVFYFDFDQSILKPESRAALTAHAERLKNNSRAVRLEGHADERGTREYNMALGERRANAVRDFLVLQGVSRSRIETVSYGEERPASMGSSESSWGQNRRVELVAN